MSDNQFEENEKEKLEKEIEELKNKRRLRIYRNKKRN